MRVRGKLAVGAAVVTAGLAMTASAPAAPDDDYGAQTFTAKLRGFQEVPALSTPARGNFRATLRGKKIKWRLHYERVRSGATMAHIHFGQPGVNGGISVFLCSNMPGAPKGTKRCPRHRATLRGTIRRKNVVGPAGQGIKPKQLGELVKAMRAGVTYANVHSTKYPGGEIRGQIKLRR